MSEPITVDEVIDILGQNYRVDGDELIWQCPGCPGGDKHADNLKFNIRKHILKCFACNYGSIVVQQILKKRNSGYKPKSIEIKSTQVCLPPKPPAIPRNKLFEYYKYCHNALLHRPDIIEKLYHKHNISRRVIEACLIGYDGSKDTIVFPSITIDKTFQLIPNGAEYREYQGDKIIRRVSGYESRLCVVSFSYNNKTQQAPIAYICEGYKDGYNLLELIFSVDYTMCAFVHIYTTQNGAQSINANRCLEKINWDIYSKIYLVLDNDKAGDEATKNALEVLPKEKTIDGRYKFEGFKDITEYCIRRYNNNVHTNSGCRFIFD